MAILSDEFYYQLIRIDTINTRVYADIIAKEGDANGRGLLLTLTENGLMKDTTGIALNLKWEHTSVGNQGLDNFDAVDLSKGLYKITYPTEMLNRGKIRAFIQIVDSGKLAGTRNIEITVDRGVGDDIAIASSDSFSALASALIEVQSWNDRIDDVEQDFIDRANNLDATYPTRLVSVEQQLADRVDELALLSLSNQLAETVEDVELAHSKIKRNNENTFGTYENAAVESIIANDEGQRPEVLGIRLEDDHILATYTNRDSVASYHSNRSRKPSYNIDNVTYTVNSVTVPPGIDLSKIKNGMIIDTKHNPKFSGFIVGVVGQKILINNWYEMGNTTKGQVPAGTTGIFVDPMTTPWVDNSNLYLAAEDDSLDGVVFEGGIINEKADNIGKAFNAVSLGTKSPEVGFKTTGSVSPFMQGFNAHNANAAFVNSNEDVNGFLLYNEKTGYRIKNGGRQNKLLLEIAYASTNRTFDPRNAPIYLIDTPGIVRILSPSGMGGAIVYVLNILPSEIWMEWSYWKPDNPGSIIIPAQSMKILVSDGNSWYHF